MPPGSLTVVGTGIRAGMQLTPEARAAIEAADELLYLVADPVAERVIVRLRPDARSLAPLYRPGRERSETYEEMAEAILERVRAGRSVCVAFYGHPGVLVTPGHETVGRARSEGFEAEMLPGISAEDALFADLGLDPGISGCQTYEASRFLASRPAVELSAMLVLWQIGTVDETRATEGAARNGFEALAERLLELFPADREAIVYEASPWAGVEPGILRTTIGALAQTEVAAYGSLVIPPPST
jgi:uncharacterized protein YabN with tetrapyrrole methylase and pyrophosphatase domain